MKKRLILLTALLSIALVGCGDNKDTNATVETSVPVETATPAPTVEPTATPTPEPTATPTPEPSTETEISKSEINDNDTQVAEGTVDEDNVDETPAPTETPVETPAETPAPTEQPSTTEQEKTDFAKSLSEEEKESYKEILGLSEEEINQLTREEFSELVYKWMHSNNSGSNSSGGGNNSSSSNSSGSSNSAPVEGDADGDGLPDFQLGDHDIPGSM